jgi:hypothetical protein
MPKKKGHQKGAQRRPEGQHGPRAHEAFLDQLHSGPNAAENIEPRSLHSDPAKSRLFARNREQRDEAELNSEKTRLERDIDRHGHVRENFQVTAGAESHPATPRSRINPENPDAPNPADETRTVAQPKRVPGVGKS